MAEGKIAQIIGTVIDIEFPPEQLPSLFNAVDIFGDDGHKVVTEV
jgi:F-type H+/Na+-transporting ATPase subunit beta